MSVLIHTPKISLAFLAGRRRQLGELAVRKLESLSVKGGNEQVAVGALGALIAPHLGDAATGDTVNALLGPEHDRVLPPEVLVTVSGRLADGLARVFEAVAAMSVLAVVAAMFFPNARIATAPVAPIADVAPE